MCACVSECACVRVSMDAMIKTKAIEPSEAHKALDVGEGRVFASFTLFREKIEGVGAKDCCTQNRKGPPLFKNDSLAIILEIIHVGPVEMEKQRDRYTLCETHKHTHSHTHFG